MPSKSQRRKGKKRAEQAQSNSPAEKLDSGSDEIPISGPGANRAIRLVNHASDKEEYEELLRGMKNLTHHRVLITDPEEIRLLREGPSYPPPRRVPTLDPVLDSILDRTHELDTTGPGKPVKKSTYSTPRRQLYRWWPRDPDGQIYQFEGLEGREKRAPNACRQWGATLHDFYQVHRLPFYEGVITFTSGSRLAAWCREVGELDYAKDELDWAANERDPWRREAADIAIVHMMEVDYPVVSGRVDEEILDARMLFGKKVTSKTPFHPSSYPDPWPIRPFAGLAPRLETQIPLHLLPEKLVVHDPWNLLNGTTKSWNDYDEDVDLDKINPWPFNWQHSRPLDYEPHTYKLNLTSSGTEKIDKARESIKASTPESPVSILTYVFPSKESGETREPAFCISVPTPPPPPTHTPEAHLFLTQHPDRRLGVGNHSIVYAAEWEVPREWFVTPRICMGCIMDKALEFRRKWITEEESKQRNGYTISDAARLDAFKFDRYADWMLPVITKGDITLPDDEMKVWEDAPGFERSSIPVLGRLYAVVGNVQVDTKTYVRPKIVLDVVSAHELWEENQRLAKERRGDKPDPWAEGKKKVREIHGQDEGTSEENVGTSDTEPVDVKGKGRAQEVEGEIMGAVKVCREWDVEDMGNCQTAKADDCEEFNGTFNPEGGLCSKASSGDQGRSEEDKPEIMTTSTFQYKGGLCHVYISSVPWLNPGDPPCYKHGSTQCYSIVRPDVVGEDDIKIAASKETRLDLKPIPLVRSFYHPDNCRLPPTMRVMVTAKLSKRGDRHLAQEALNYQRFDKSFSEHWGGYNMCHPIKEPVPCGAIAPAFYGYYVHDEEVGRRDEDGDEKMDNPGFLSPLLLLEDCGQPIEPGQLSKDDRIECAGLLERFHHLGWEHGSFYPRNILVRKGDHEDFPPHRNPEDLRFRQV
ncbi:hypothetical protein PM082_005984 [Marasmius tenuissimus]|nr:hypothetical protein PM082_005984 [Marasmius tenuissimus]